MHRGVRMWLAGEGWDWRVRGCGWWRCSSWGCPQVAGWVGGSWRAGVRWEVNYLPHPPHPPPVRAGVHGGILARRNLPEHVSAIQEAGITPIDVVVVNLYPFRATVTAATAPSFEVRPGRWAADGAVVRLAAGATPWGLDGARLG